MRAFTAIRARLAKLGREATPQTTPEDRIGRCVDAWTADHLAHLGPADLRDIAAAPATRFVAIAHQASCVAVERPDLDGEDLVSAILKGPLLRGVTAAEVTATLERLAWWYAEAGRRIAASGKAARTAEPRV
jgi:hypothetical protein